MENARFVDEKAANIISAETPVIYAQLIYAARNEMVITLEDLVMPRTQSDLCSTLTLATLR